MGTPPGETEAVIKLWTAFLGLLAASIPLVRGVTRKVRAFLRSRRQRLRASASPQVEHDMD